MTTKQQRSWMYNQLKMIENIVSFTLILGLYLFLVDSGKVMAAIDAAIKADDSPLR